MTDLNHGILGIDISKLKFDVALMIAAETGVTQQKQGSGLEK